MGLAGALVTVYGVIGGTIPTGAGARLEAEYAELAKTMEQFGQLKAKAAADPASVPAAGEFSLETDRLRDDLERKRKALARNWGLAYALLGMFFALLLAKDLLQALTYGAGWTALAGALGIKTEVDAAKAALTQQAETLDANLDRVQQANVQMRAAIDSQPTVAWQPGMDVYHDSLEEARQAVVRTKLRSARM